MAMDPALGMNNIGYASPSSPNREFITTTLMFPAQKVLLQGLDFILAVNHKLNVVSGCPADIAVTMLVGYLTHFSDMTNTGQSWGPTTNSVDLIPAFSLMHQDTWFQDLVPEPLTKIVFNNRR